MGRSHALCITFLDCCVFLCSQPGTAHRPWHSYFDFIVVDARKPLFFDTGELFWTIVRCFTSCLLLGRVGFLVISIVYGNGVIMASAFWNVVCTLTNHVSCVLFFGFFWGGGVASFEICKWMAGCCGCSNTVYTSNTRMYVNVDCCALLTEAMIVTRVLKYVSMYAASVLISAGTVLRQVDPVSC